MTFEQWAYIMKVRLKEEENKYEINNQSVITGLEIALKVYKNYVDDMLKCPKCHGFGNIHKNCILR